MRPHPSFFRRYILGFFKRLFGKRTIIVIADHKRDHYPIDGRVQFLGVIAMIALVSWVSYSTGNYMAAQKELEAQEREMVNKTLRAKKIENEFALLKRDLSSLIKEEKTSDAEVSDYTKFVIEQYENQDQETFPDIRGEVAKSEVTIDGDIIFERISFLENTVRELREGHENLLMMVEKTTKGKIKDLQAVIAKTGLPLKKLEAQAEKMREREEAAMREIGEDGPLGGPYIDEFMLDAEPRERSIYEDLQEMMVLHQVQNALPISAPMKVKHRLTSGYGVRRDPYTKKPAYHNGLDFAGPRNAPIHAPADGVVTFAGKRGGYGNFIEIEHEFGILTRYGHLNAIHVREGQKISVGDKLGLQGSTGRSTGPHLHYEVRHNGKYVNPRNFIRAGAIAVE